MSANLVSKRVLAAILGVTESSLSSWQKESPAMPVLVLEGRGGSNQYDTHAVIAWMLERAVRKAGHESAKDRLARVQADMVELLLAEKRGELTPTANIRPAWSGFILAARETLRGFPVTVAPQLALLQGVDAIRDLLGEQVDAVLHQLADGSST